MELKHLPISPQLRHRITRIGTALLMPFLLWGGGTATYQNLHYAPEGVFYGVVIGIGLGLSILVVCSGIATWGWSTRAAWPLDHLPRRFFVCAVTNLTAFVVTSLSPLMADSYTQQNPVAWILLITAGAVTYKVFPAAALTANQPAPWAFELG